MSNPYDTSDLPDNFDPSWDEPMTEQEWDDWRDGQTYDDSRCDEYYETSDADWWESAYGPADDGGWAF